MLFQFKLRPVHDIEPWGKEGGYSLGWFGLTDGWYWLKCDETELFRYTDAVLAARNYVGRQRSDPPCVDYQIVRLWEDILEIMPDILTPVPKELLHKIEPCIDALKWRAQITESVFSDEGEVSEQMENKFDLATTWLNRRTLNSMHLKKGPQIWLWTDGSTMFIRWNNAGLTMNDQTVWTGIEGTYSLPLGEFIQEIKSFNERLMKAMKERVQAIQDSWDRPSIYIDKKALVAEQEQRARALPEALRRVRNHQPPAWAEVIDAISYFEQKGYALPKIT